MRLCHQVLGKVCEMMTLRRSVNGRLAVPALFYSITLCDDAALYVCVSAVNK